MGKASASTHIPVRWTRLKQDLDSKYCTPYKSITVHQVVFFARFAQRQGKGSLLQVL